MTSYIHPPTARKGPALPNHSAIKCITDGTSLLAFIYPHYFWRNVIDVIQLYMSNYCLTSMYC